MAKTSARATVKTGTGKKKTGTVKKRRVARLSAHEIYARLKAMILDFELYPGSRITEMELADYFKVSRTPVREALQRLESEGSVVIRPKQGCFVREIDMSEITQYYDVRLTLESMAIDLACQHMSDEDIRALMARWDPQTRPGMTDNVEKMVAREEGFHIDVAIGGGNTVLVNYLQDINNRIRIIRRLDFTSSTRIDATYEEHHAIAEAIFQRDAQRGKQLIREHIAASEEFAKSLTLDYLSRQRGKLALA